MPKAVVDINDTKEVKLKSCPGGVVKLKRMSYGQKLERQTLAMEATAGGKGKDAGMALQMMQKRAVTFEFASCIVDHNLEGANGEKLNFALPSTVDVLDPRVGDEISEYIDEMNNFEETDEAKN